jgi:hypothetical protein
MKKIKKIYFFYFPQDSRELFHSLSTEKAKKPLPLKKEVRRDFAKQKAPFPHTNPRFERGTFRLKNE